MPDLRAEIQAMVDRETRAWDARDAQSLVALFHPDMVWAWPPDSFSHDPATWVLQLGRFDRPRWQAAWQDLFDAHELVHNHRDTVRIEVSGQGDGAFAVVDVDTLWRDRTTGALVRWRGRACKGYTRLASGWRLIFHTGLLDYSAVKTGAV
jgi:ketosteroid isomerase-like protein